MNWGIEVSKHNLITGKVVYRPDESIEKTKILMKDGCFNNGEHQPLYFPMDHPDKNLQGKFKGMAVILWVLAVEFWNSLTLSHPISVKFLRSVKAYTTKISY